MTVIDSTHHDLIDLRRQLAGRLDDLARRVRSHLLVGGAARVLAVTLVLALASYGVDRWLRLGLATRLILLAAAMVVLAVQAWRHLLAPARLRMSPVELAAALDRRQAASTNAVAGYAPGHGRPLASRVASVMQLPELLGGAHAPSPSMVRAAVLRSHESLRDEALADRVDRRRLRADQAAIAALLVVAVALVAAGPPSAGLWFRRWFLGSNQPWPQRTYLQVAGLQDGKLLVPRGEPAVLLAGVRPGSEEPEAVTVALRDAVAPAGTAGTAGVGPSAGGPMTKFAAGDFRHDLPPLQGPVTVRLTGGDDEFGPFTVEPVDRPRVASLALTSRHPSDGKPVVNRFSGEDADVAFLPQTELELRFAASVPVAEARLRTAQDKGAAPGKGGSASLPAAPVGPSTRDVRRIDDRTFAVRWTHTRPVSFEIELVGQVGGLTSAPTPVAVGLKVDQPPRVTLAQSGVRSRVSPQARLPLTVQARDDYGLARLDLTVRVEPPPSDMLARSATATTGPAVGPATAPAGPSETVTALLAPATQSTSAPARPSDANTEVQRRQVVELSPLGLSPGALVAVTARATDTCYTGPQTTPSRTLTFRVVAPEELFREILQRQQAERAKFRKQVDEAQKVRRDLAAAVTDDALAGAARQQKLVQREVNRIADSLGGSLTEMKLNALGGREAYDLMEQKILAPLKALNAELMEPQRDALDRLGRPAAPARLAEAAARQEQIVDRMKAVLAQMAQWDSFVDVLNQLNEVIRVQQQVRKATEQMKDKETDSLFK